MKLQFFLIGLGLLATSVDGAGELTMWTDSSSAVTGGSCEYANSGAVSGGSTPWLDTYVTPGMYCAVSDDLYENGVGCGKCYTIVYNSADGGTDTATSGTANVQVVDSGAGGSEHFDCFVTAFETLTGIKTGIFPVSFTQIDCAPQPLTAVIMDGNNAFYVKVNQLLPIVSSC
jgi:hypothetical protein